MLFYLLLKKELRKYASHKRKESNERFFKTGKGEYGEGDKFMGISVPDIRRVVKRFYDIGLADIKKLLRSPIHEERLAGLLILVYKFEHGGSREKESIYDFYLSNMGAVNNWDLVDLSAPKILGAYLYNKRNKRGVLYELARLPNLWKRRIAIIATFYFIQKEDFNDVLRISKILIDDKHDLIHKAVGWMLREIGKRNLAVEERFLKRHYSKMPRTMLRYAIERFNEKERRAYLEGIV